MMPPVLLVAGHRFIFCQLPHTHKSSVAEVIDVHAEKIPRPGDFACSCVQLALGRRVRIAGGDDQSRRWFHGAGRFRKERTREALFMYSIGVYASKRSARRRRPADNPKGISLFEQHIYQDKYQIREKC